MTQQSADYTADMARRQGRWNEYAHNVESARGLVQSIAKGKSDLIDAETRQRMALLEADVNFKVARDFIERVKVKSLGAEVVQSVQPGQQIVKFIHDELVDLLGSTNAGLNLAGNPACIMMVGLHGAGKTTSSGKLAKLLLKQGRQPLLVAADVYRPAAMDQIATLGQQLGIPTFVKKGETDVLKIAKEAFAVAKDTNSNMLIFDTAGRLQIDEPLVQELVRLRDLIKPQEILLVLDAATGQEVLSLKGNVYDVTSVSFSPDGSRILELSTKCLPDRAFQVAAETPLPSRSNQIAKAIRIMPPML